MSRDPTRCNDDGQRPDCLGEADPAFTMDFDDVEKGAKIFWCSHCGAEARAMNDALVKAFKDDSSFARKFEKVLDEVEERRRVEAN